MAKKEKRRHDPLFARFGVLVLLCCACGLVLYFAVRWWSTWWLEVSKDPTAIWKHKQSFGVLPVTYPTELETGRLDIDGQPYTEMNYYTLEELLNMSDDKRSSLTVRLFRIGSFRLGRLGKSASSPDEDTSPPLQEGPPNPRRP